MTRTYTGVVDRFENEGEQAVVLLEPHDESEPRSERIIARSDLPEDARHVDAILTIEVQEDTLQDITYQAEETKKRGEDAQSRFDSLSKRPPGSQEEPEDETTGEDEHEDERGDDPGPS